MKQIENESIETAAASWLARQDQERWTRADERELQIWLNQSSAHRVAWLRLKTVWMRADQMKALANTNNEARKFVPARSNVRPRWIAATLVSAGFLIAGVFLRAAWEPAGEEHYSTPVGGLESITLADGSRLTLNTRTRARAVVNDRERKVWLEEGEAFFEVQHDPARPFIVSAGRDRITVLGTKFSVRYESGRTQVTVLEGKVRLDQGTGQDQNLNHADISSHAEKTASTLVTNNDLLVSQAGGVLVINKTAEQVQQNLSWRQGRLVFDQMTLGEIAAEFNRYNRRQMVIEGEAAEVRLGGSFDAHNVEVFARLVHEGFGLKLSTDKDAIRLSSN